MNLFTHVRGILIEGANFRREINEIFSVFQENVPKNEDSLNI